MENQPLAAFQPFIREAWKKAGFADFTPVQEKVIPEILAGRDVISESPTGTGKTLAYLLPLLEKLRPDSKNVQAVILVPTRELAMQIYQEIEKFSAGSGNSAAALVGGADMKRQIEKLKQHPQMVVGTPGRILELIQAKKLKMHEVKAIVVDESDQILNLKLMDTVKEIVKTTLRDRQLLFFSATLSRQVEQVANDLMKDAQVIRIMPKDLPVAQVEHFYFVCERRDKIDVLRRVIRMGVPKAVAFVNDSAQVEEFASKLAYKGISLGVLHGQSWKTERERELKHFREGKFPLLLATDLAARGLDVEGITHVIHVDLPAGPDQYIHRSGRTGRMGAKGTVLSIVTPQEEPILKKYGEKLGIPLQKKTLFAGKITDEKPPARQGVRSRFKAKSGAKARRG